MMKDEFRGVGGSYILDTKTGTRKRAEPPTKPAQAAPADASGTIGTRPDDAAPGVQVDSQGLGPIADGRKKRSDQ